MPSLPEKNRASSLGTVAFHRSVVFQLSSACRRTSGVTGEGQGGGEGEALGAVPFPSPTQAPVLWGEPRAVSSPGSASLAGARFLRLVF